MDEDVERLAGEVASHLRWKSEISYDDTEDIVKRLAFDPEWGELLKRLQPGDEVKLHDRVVQLIRHMWR